MFSKAMVQGPTRLANVGVGSFGTLDSVHHPFLWCAGTGSLGCTSSCLRILMGRKITWIARVPKTLQMDSDSPVMYRKVTDPRVTWSRGVRDQTLGTCASV